MLQVSINDQRYDFPEGMTILDALRQLKIEVPTLCYDERIEAYGGCRLCMVRVTGNPKLVTACQTPLVDGMAIETHSPEIENLRKTNLKLLATHYPQEAVEKNPHKEFHRWLYAYGLEHEACGKFDLHKQDRSHPYLSIDMSQCITCYRCVNICNDVQGQFVWQVNGRGDRSQIVPDSGTTLLESTCVSCGACADTCPTGAIADQSGQDQARTYTRTTCPYCGVGCEMDVGVAQDRIVTVRPALNSPVNRGHLCVKGRYAFDFVDASDRVTTPLIRKNGQLTPCSWDEAFAAIKSELQRILSESGPKSLGLLGSSRATNEENYVAQKFARVVLGTNNVDCCARVCHTPSAAAMKWMLGTGAATNSFDDIEVARTLLICGANPTENHPVIGARIKQRVLQGAKMIVIDPRATELARMATIHLALKPGTNVLLLNAMAATLVEEGLMDKSYLANRIDGFDAYFNFIRPLKPEIAASICGIDPEVIREAARLYATEKPSMCFHGLGLTEHTQGTEGVMCLVNLALLTGNLGKPGTGINPLRGQNNVQGAAHMGCDPSILTGSVSVQGERLRFEKVWGATIPSEKGLNLLAMMDAAGREELKALWVIGYDVYLTNPKMHETRQAFEKLKFVVVQDLFLNETAREFASVFLPVASGFEKDGTYMNAERRISRVRRVVSPRGQSKTDWEILCEVAAAMGKGEHFPYRSAEEIWNEVRSVWQEAQGISYARIEKHGLQWPCMDLEHPGTKILHAETFSFGKTTQIKSIPFEPTPEKTNAEYPFLLTTGRNLYHFNAGTMTQRTPNHHLRKSDFLDLNPLDAHHLGLREGETARLISRYGEATLPVRFTHDVKPGEAFATFHTPEFYLNHVTSGYRDRKVHAPEYKVTAVRIEKSNRCARSLV